MLAFSVECLCLELQYCTIWVGLCMHFANREKLAHSQIMIKIPSGNQTWKRTIPENFPLGTSIRFPIAMTRVTPIPCLAGKSYTYVRWCFQNPHENFGHINGISQPCLIASRYDGNIVLIAGAGLRRRLAHGGLRNTQLSRSAEVVLGGETKGIAAPRYILYRVEHFFHDFLVGEKKGLTNII